jgi:ribosomal protein S18 acetylase RimI-like enzyme
MEHKVLSRSIRVRLAEIADAPALARIGAATFAETFADKNTSDDIQAYLQANFRPEIQAKELAEPGTAAFLAEVSQTSDQRTSWLSAGYAKLHRSEPPDCVADTGAVELSRIYVAAGYHGQGIGAALMSACLDTARKQGARTIWLGVWERNTRAIEFYRGFGFAECGDHDFVLGSDRQRDLIMIRRIE